MVFVCFFSIHDLEYKASYVFFIARNKLIFILNYKKHWFIYIVYNAFLS